MQIRPFETTEYCVFFFFSRLKLRDVCACVYAGKAWIVVVDVRWMSVHVLACECWYVRVCSIVS